MNLVPFLYIRICTIGLKAPRVINWSERSCPTSLFEWAGEDPLYAPNQVNVVRRPQLKAACVSNYFIHFFAGHVMKWVNLCSVPVGQHRLWGD